MARMSYEANKQKTRVPMPELDPVERAKTFDEVALGYSEEGGARGASLHSVSEYVRERLSCGVRLSALHRAGGAGQFRPRLRHCVKSANALPAIRGRVPAGVAGEGVHPRQDNEPWPSAA